MGFITRLSIDFSLLLRFNFCQSPFVVLCRSTHDVSHVETHLTDGLLLVTMYEENLHVLLHLESELYLNRSCKLGRL